MHWGQESQLRSHIHGPWTMSQWGQEPWVQWGGGGVGGVGVGSVGAWGWGWGLGVGGRVRAGWGWGLGVGVEQGSFF